MPLHQLHSQNHAAEVAGAVETQNPCQQLPRERGLGVEDQAGLAVISSISLRARRKLSLGLIRRKSRQDGACKAVQPCPGKHAELNPRLDRHQESRARSFSEASRFEHRTLAAPIAPEGTKNNSLNTSTVTILEAYPTDYRPSAAASDEKSSCARARGSTRS